MTKRPSRAQRAQNEAQRRAWAEREANLRNLTALAQRPDLPPLAFDFSSDDDLLEEVRENLDDAARNKERFANGVPINGWTR